MTLTIKRLEKDVDILCASISLFLFLTFSSIASEASPPPSQRSITTWPKNEQLAQSTILNVLESKSGMLWIATLSGLARFDGTQIIEYSPYRNGKGFIDTSSIIAILEDSEGRIYVAAEDAGLLQYNDASDSFYPALGQSKGYLPKQSISSAYADTKGNILLGFSDGSIFSYSHQAGYLEILRSAGNSPVSDFTESKSGEIYAALSTGSIFGFLPGANKFQSINVSESCRKKFSGMTQLELLDDNRFLVGTAGRGIFLVNIDKKTCPQVDLGGAKPTTVEHLHVRAILSSSDTNLHWIATDQGLYLLYPDRSTEHLDSKNSNLSDNEVISLYQGRDNILWIGTYRGLNYSVPTIFRNYDSRANTQLHSLVSIDSSDAHDIWIATYYGLLSYDEASDVHLDLSQSKIFSGLTDQRIMSLHIDTKGMWVGYRSTGLEHYRFQDKVKTSFSVDGNLQISSNSVSAILTTRSQKTLVGTYGGGLNVIEDFEVRDTYSLGDNKIIMIYETMDGVIWLATESNVYQLDIEAGDISEFDFEMPSGIDAGRPVIWNMAESGDGDLWFGSKHHGLFFWSFSDRELGNISAIVPLLSPTRSVSTIYAVELDDEGNVWCSTNRGLVRFESDSREAEVFSTHHGIDSTEFDFGVSHKDYHGRIYFGGSEGYIRFDPRQLDADPRIPRITLTGIELYNISVTSPGKVNALETLHLTHKDNFVKFEFSVLDFLDPDKNQYRYMLEGFDSVWIENGTNNAATYTNLPAGNYVLRVQGSNSAGVWNREGISLNLVVAAAPWYTWWAYCLYFLVGSIIFWLGTRAYISYAVERKANQLAIDKHEAAERADDELQEQIELQDDLVKSVYRHNIGTLDLVSNFISQQSLYLDDDAALRAADSNVKRVKALAVLEECLYYQDDHLAADLHKYTDIVISTLLEDSPVRTETITTINEVNSGHVPIELASRLSIIIYELLENSIQHAFEDKSPANFIEIAFHAVEYSQHDGPCYELTVKDSGVGIPANIDTQSMASPGLAIVKSLAQSLGGTLVITAEQGTVVKLLIDATPASNTPRSAELFLHPDKPGSLD